MRNIVAARDFFFFQAEDGIRYIGVTGVQTCALPISYDRTIADEIVAVSDGDSFAMTRRLAREEGLLVGASCGMAVARTLGSAVPVTRDGAVVVLWPDGGPATLAKMYNAHYMAQHRFLQPPA